MYMFINTPYVQLLFTSYLFKLPFIRTRVSQRGNVSQCGHASKISLESLKREVVNKVIVNISFTSRVNKLRVMMKFCDFSTKFWKKIVYMNYKNALSKCSITFKNYKAHIWLTFFSEYTLGFSNITLFQLIV